MSEDFGSYLKHERELRGIPLDDIAKTTKINLRFLRALEESRFEDLPGEVFIKGFIRSYGQAIGSNVDELLAVYHESGSHQQDKAAAATATPQSQAKPQSPPSEFPMKAVLGFAAAILVVAAGGYWITVKNGDNAGPSRQTRQSPAPATVDNRLPGFEGETGLSEEAGEAESVAPDGTSETPETPEAVETAKLPAPPPEPAPAEPPAAETPPAKPPIKNTVTVPEKDAIMKDLQDQSVPETISPAVEPTAGDAPLELVIRVSENSWFNLRIDDFRDQDFILPPGGSKTIQANNAVVMTIGNRRATELLLNGQPLDLPESPDNVIRNFTVNAEQLN